MADKGKDTNKVKREKDEPSGYFPDDTLDWLER